VIKPIKVIVADDHQLVREGMSALLASEHGVEVIGEAGDGRTAVKLAKSLEPDVVVMDISMPDLNGIDATRQIRSSGDGPQVIALSVHCNTRFTSEMLRAGAMGFIPKKAAFVELTTALRLVASNQMYLSPLLNAETIDAVADDRDRLTVFSKLSSREREVLQLVAEGKAMKEVAMMLNISIKTVETHRKNIMDKLAIDTVAELTKYAIREGITSI
jgi:DNA-binding NarL/FixJ family response regulator